ncbi:flagellar motor switch protein FliM [Phaeobacter gallaeciensis]|uniref:Flagellar motor switch protein FliM n=2 Tax=Roseobacteraceae TaxID=2854170 RepID=A0A366X2D3_9RHOB|nr:MULTISPECIES: FliM/FliN family flagellar motor C-terminal domain-containing protein [Roseobacteraceae]MBT3139526.1 FliM/FliN family flagellar motor C-terminal domain-containing protein [Falsiruegeria litorea]MBT8170055.1 FliM/FliN family flagellar motor C-terminal domain-containing protein [Falsiruegeria litorea]RBW58613.1 flagellar motor switch protein FliM [Phaeobacter gallaeciensis]
MDADTLSILARKVALAQDDGQDSKRSILRALRLSLARAADDTFDLAMSVIGATQARRSAETLAAGVAEDRLYLLLLGPEDRMGAACVDRACLTAIIQQQTMGQVFEGAPSERAFTGTDAAMVAPLIDTILPRAADQCETLTDRRCLTGYEFCSRVEDSRALLLAMEADDYRTFDLTIEIAGGKAQGQITLILPDIPDLVEDMEESDGAEAGLRLDQSFGVMRADLQAVISRVRLPLSAFADMKPGDVLPLIGNKLDRTEILTIDGKQIALARLGQCRGVRAVRLNETKESDVVVEPYDAGFQAHGAASEKDALSTQGVDNLTHPDVIDHTDFVTAPDSEAVPQPASVGQEQPLFDMNSDLAAVEISQLAGLGEEEDAFPQMSPSS